MCSSDLQCCEIHALRSDGQPTNGRGNGGNRLVGALANVYLSLYMARAASWHFQAPHLFTL